MKTIDEIGKMYGRWKVLERATSKNGAYWLCECQCQTKTRHAIKGSFLRNGSTFGCLVCTDTTIDETGKIYGRWKVLEQAKKPKKLKDEGAYWLCECQCPLKIRKIIRGGSLREGQSLSCGCYRYEMASKIRNIDTPYNNLIGKYRYSAKKRKITFDLTFDDIKQLVVQNCHYCGVKPSQTDCYLKKHNFYYNGIDRIDNTKGYLFDNCVACCNKCNKAKMQMTYKEFREWVTIVYERMFTHPLYFQ